MQQQGGTQQQVACSRVKGAHYERSGIEHPDWYSQQDLPEARLRYRSDAFGRQRGRKVNVDLQSQRRGKLVLEKSSKCAVLWIGPPDEFTFIPAKTESVIPMVCAWLPQGPLARQDRRKRIFVGQNLARQRFFNHGQAGL